MSGKHSIPQSVEEREIFRKNVLSHCNQAALTNGLMATFGVAVMTAVWCHSKYFPFVRRYYPVTILGSSMITLWTVTKVSNRHCMAKKMRAYGPWVMFPDTAKEQKRQRARLTNIPDEADSCNEENPGTSEWAEGDLLRDGGDSGANGKFI